MSVELPAPPGALRYEGLLDIVGDIARVRAVGPALGELGLIEQPGWSSLGRVIEIQGDVLSLQVFRGGIGLSRGASVRFLGVAMTAPCSRNVLGRVLRGDGEPRDGGPSLAGEARVEVAGPTANPFARALPSRMIRTDVPMIDIFNPLVESQKLPIFSVAGEPYNALLARVGLGADADIVVFAGLGLIFDDYHFFRTAFEDAGLMHRTVMVVNLAGDALVERVLAQDLALAIAEWFAIEEKARVLVLMTDMTAYADALKEIGIALERIPAARGYTGDLYTQLARRYEKACDFRDGGSITILTVTTLPGDDVTHPVPDNTGYITEGQLYLHGGMLDPFGSLSRLKQHVIGKVTRADHGELANAMIRLYAQAEDAERKRAMAFDLSDYDQRLLAYRAAFRTRFMSVHHSTPLETALDEGWELLARHFAPTELLVRDSLLAAHYRRPQPA
ncbi:MAG: V-type ATP synthase subunit B [Porphyrobacter sp.]|nr:V-type ATP synthase subunit B [Porphyrobacter sp.]